MEKFKLQSIARYYNITMEERPLPDDEEMERVVAERITALLEARLRSRDNLEVERMQRFIPLARNLAQAEESLIRKALADSGENRTLAAKKLGISRRTLHRHLSQLGILKHPS